jgi:hypothetical protein
MFQSFINIECKHVDDNWRRIRAKSVKFGKEMDD